MTHIEKTKNRNDLTGENRRNLQRISWAVDEVEDKMTRFHQIPALSLDTGKHAVDMLEEVAAYLRGIGYGLLDIGAEYSANDQGDYEQISPEDYTEALTAQQKIYAQLSHTINLASEEAKRQFEEL